MVIHEGKEAAIWRQLEQVVDPELPFLNVVEMGMVRDVSFDETGPIISITPTYTGCPATDVILKDIQDTLMVFHPDVRVVVVQHPAWTTDWIGDAARRKMKENGIAPPEGSSHDKAFLLGKSRQTPCPLCGSNDTKLVSAFGSTACKAHYTCGACLEPFDHFKCF